jgi:hypothetical protein
MSRSGRNTKPEAPVAPAPAEIPPEVRAQYERHARAERIFILCHANVVSADPALWDGPSIGAAIGERWVLNLVRASQAAAANPRVRAQAAGLALPT